MSELDNMTTNPADIATEETSKQSSDATSVADALKDIIDLAEQTKAAGSTSVFNRYRNQAEIAREIANVLFSKKYNSGGSGKRSRSLPQGFFATDFDKSQVGLLTECYGLQIIYSLSRMGLDVGFVAFEDARMGHMSAAVALDDGETAHGNAVFEVDGVRYAYVETAIDNAHSDVGQLSSAYRITDGNWTRVTYDSETGEYIGDSTVPIGTGTVTGAPMIYG